MEELFRRPDYRKPDELRAIEIHPNIAPNADGSVMIAFDKTKVICAAMIEKKIPKWMIQQSVPGGWITSEYSMLPYSTLERKERDSTKGKVDGRTIEIQRMIGRAIRSVFDLLKMDGMTLWLDCDVLQADGGTRVAAINGAYLAAQLAIRKHMKLGNIKENPFKDGVAAVSVGIFQNNIVLDLNYEEDKDADVDFNVVMTHSGQFVEIQGMGEEAVFSQEQLDSLLKLAKKGISSIQHQQVAFLEKKL